MNSNNSIGDEINALRDELRITPEERSIIRHGGERKRGKYSNYRGVSYDKYKNRFVADIMKLGKSYRLGYFKTEEEAARAYDKAAKILYGINAKLNFPESL